MDGDKLKAIIKLCIVFLICFGIYQVSISVCNLLDAWRKLSMTEEYCDYLHSMIERDLKRLYEDDTLYELAEVVNTLEWKIPYKKGSFECGEMAGYLEWYLERRGWHTLIAVGAPPHSSTPVYRAEKKVKHAWLLVETSSGRYTPVEPTVPKVIFPSDPDYDKYFDYNHLFESAAVANAYYPGEFDWWNVGMS